MLQPVAVCCNVMQNDAACVAGWRERDTETDIHGESARERFKMPEGMHMVGHGSYSPCLRVHSS